MDTLDKVVEETMWPYVAKGFNGYSTFMKNEGQHFMTVVAKFTVQGESFVETSLLAHIVGEKIIIEDDKTNKLLVDALLQAGVPRGQIVLAYAGETVEETA
jgi:hypothetical protein